MNINSKLTEEVAKVSVDLTKKIKETTSKEGIINEVRLETPKGLSGEYFHPGLIQKAEKGFNVEKAIESFNDINDTPTIEKICDSWRAEYEKLLEDFSPENIGKMKDPKAEHQKALQAINEKYEKFTDKIYEMFEHPETQEKAGEVFTTHIEPITQLSMETYSKIDQTTAMAQAYAKDRNVVGELESRILKCGMLEDIQRVILDVEKMKTSDPEGYQKLNKIMEERIEKIATQTSDTTASEVSKSGIVKKAEQEKESVMKYSSMSVADLENEIEKMTAEEVMSGEKVGQIYGILDNMRLSGDASYTTLKATFDKKLTDIAGMM